MPTRDVERYNKAVRWNIGSLLTKCEHYSNLRGIELALYVSFPEDGGFVSYDSANLSWRQDIEAKKAHTPPTLLLLEPLVRSIGHKVTGFRFEQSRGRCPRWNMMDRAGQLATESRSEGLEEADDVPVPGLSNGEGADGQFLYSTEFVLHWKAMLHTLKLRMRVEPFPIISSASPSQRQVWSLIAGPKHWDELSDLLREPVISYIAERDLSRYLSLKQIFLGIRPLNNITWLDLITTVVFVSANAVAISYGVQDIAGFIRRSDVFGFGKLSDKSGIVITSVLVAIPLTSLIRRRAYEAFAAAHFTLAVCAAVFIYLHTPSSHVLESPKRCLVAAASCLGLTCIIRLGLLLYRNVRLGSPSSRAAIRTITFDLKESSISLEDAVHIHIRLSRPWNVRAGQYVYLTIPGSLMRGSDEPSGRVSTRRPTFVFSST
ncbi:hypothetical protein VD0002_g5155 [Verticillium dahliae]|nr:hypothetical protein VD0002_g5155 [Verticillium dahliae]